MADNITILAEAQNCVSQNRKNLKLISRWHRHNIYNNIIKIYENNIIKIYETYTRMVKRSLGYDCGSQVHLSFWSVEQQQVVWRQINGNFKLWQNCKINNRQTTRLLQRSLSPVPCLSVYELMEKCSL